MNGIYATFDPGHVGAALELEQSNAVVTFSADATSDARCALATSPKSTGLWSAEAVCWGEDAIDGAVFGIARPTASLAAYVGGDANGYGYRIGAGEIHTNAASVASVTAGAKGDIVGILLDLTGVAPKVSWYRNGQLLHTQALPDFGPWCLAATVSGDHAYGLRLFLSTGARAFDYPTGQADGWYDVGEAAGSVTLASEDYMTAAADDVPHVRYTGRLPGDSDDLHSARSLDFWPWRRGVAGSAATLTVLDPDGDLAELLTRDARDLAVTVSEVAPGAAYSTRTAVLQAAIDRVEALDDVTLRLTLRDTGSVLDQPAQRRLISPAADPSSANQPWPVSLGACRTVEPVLLDAAVLTYAVHDGQVLGLGYVRDKGDPLDPEATPADYAQTDDKSGIALNTAPAGKLTVDASSIGGSGLPTAADDVLGGAGAPFAGDDGDPPTGFDDVGSNTTGASPVMSAGKLRFPATTAARTIRIRATLESSDVINTGAGIRALLSWYTDDGANYFTVEEHGEPINYHATPIVTGTSGQQQVEITAEAPAGSTRAKVSIASWNHTEGSVKAYKLEAWYVTDGGDIPIALQNPEFDDQGNGWIVGALWSFISDGSGGYFAQHAPYPDVFGIPDTTSLWNHAHIPVDQPGIVSWAGITTTQLGVGKSYRLLINIPTMPTVSGQVASRVGVATGKTADQYLWSTDKDGNYSIVITNTTGADVDLYLLAVLNTQDGAIEVDSWEAREYDDTYVPPTVGDPSVPSDLAPIKLADLMTELLDLRRGDLGVRWSRDDAEAIDTATGYAGLGIHFQSGESLRTVLQTALDSYTACPYQDRAGTLHLVRLQAPEDAASTEGTITRDAMRADLIPTPDQAPGLTTQIGVRRNWSPLADSDFVSDYVEVPLRLRRALRSDYQETRATRAQLSAAYRSALAAPAIGTALDDPNDGQAEIDRIGAIYTTRRMFYSAPLELDAVPTIELGQVWTLVYPRYGLEAGKPVLVVDLVESRLSRTIDVILWG